MQPLPHARLVPFLEASPAGHAASTAHLLGQHLPGYAALEDEQNAAEGCAVVDAWPAAVRLWGLFGQQRLDHFPQFIGNEFSSHTFTLPTAGFCYALLEGVNAQMTTVRIPDVVVAEVPRLAEPTPAPVFEADVAPMPGPPPSVPSRERELAEKFAVAVAAEVVGGLLLIAFVWYMRTGVWIFKELLTYFIQQLD